MTSKNRKAAAPADAGDTLKASVQDLQNTLQTMMGQKFEAAAEYTGGGIFLVRASSADTPANAWLSSKQKAASRS